MNLIKFFTTGLLLLTSTTAFADFECKTVPSTVSPQVKVYASLTKLRICVSGNVTCGEYSVVNCQYIFASGNSQASHLLQGSCEWHVSSTNIYTFLFTPTSNLNLVNLMAKNVDSSKDELVGTNLECIGN